MSDYFMGVDTGTHETKGVIIDIEGNIVAQSSTPHKMMNPAPGFYEHDAERDWWGGFLHGLEGPHRQERRRSCGHQVRGNR